MKTPDNTQTEPAPENARELAREIGTWIQAAPGRAESVQDAAREWLQGTEKRLEVWKEDFKAVDFTYHAMPKDWKQIRSGSHAWQVIQFHKRQGDKFAPGEREALLLRFVQAVRDSLPEFDVWGGVEELTLPPDLSPVAGQAFAFLIAEEWEREVPKVRSAFEWVKGQAEQESAPPPEYVIGQKAAAEIAGLKSDRQIRNWKKAGLIKEYPGRCYKTSELLKLSRNSGG